MCLDAHQHFWESEVTFGMYVSSVLYPLTGHHKKAQFVPPPHPDHHDPRKKKKFILKKNLLCFFFFLIVVIQIVQSYLTLTNKVKMLNSNLS